MADEQSGGGVEWEAGEALKLMVQGLIRFSEALRNGASSASAKQLIPMLMGLDAVKADRKEDVASSEHTMGMVLDQNEIEQAILGRHEATLGLMDLRLRKLEERLDALEGKVV
jgi:hypothetical protein